MNLNGSKRRDGREIKNRLPKSMSDAGWHGLLAQIAARGDKFLHEIKKEGGGVKIVVDEFNEHGVMVPTYYKIGYNYIQGQVLDLFLQVAPSVDEFRYLIFQIRSLPPNVAIQGSGDKLETMLRLLEILEPYSKTIPGSNAKT